MKRLAPISLVLATAACSTCHFGEFLSGEQQYLAAESCSNADKSPGERTTTSEVVAGVLDVNIDVGQVPVIDISALIRPSAHSTAGWDEAAEAVTRACEEWGFFQVTRQTAFCVDAWSSRQRRFRGHMELCTSR